jgi:glycosyltransferase involved in cell wall biosynthesis
MYLNKQMNKLSIITINYNNYSGLKKTMQSVFDQTWKDYEYIIIDGGSTDGSKEFIELNSDKINYWISEPDKGIYNAMNKGISIASGEYLIFINSGDELFNSNSLNILISASSNYDIIYGNILLVNNNGDIYIKKYPISLSLNHFLLSSLPHPSSIIKRNLFVNDMYIESYKIVSDWHFFLKKIIIDNASYIYINENISKFYLNGVSSKNENQYLIISEKNESLIKLLNFNYFEYITLFQSSKKYDNLKNKNIYKIILKIHNLFKWLRIL